MLSQIEFRLAKKLLKGFYNPNNQPVSELLGHNPFHVINYLYKKTGENCGPENDFSIICHGSGTMTLVLYVMVPDPHGLKQSIPRIVVVVNRRVYMIVFLLHWQFHFSPSIN